MNSVTQSTREAREQAPAAQEAPTAGRLPADVGREIAGVIQVDPAKIEGSLDQKVRESVEQTLNLLLEEQADRVCGAKR